MPSCNCCRGDKEDNGNDESNNKTRYLDQAKSSYESSSLSTYDEFSSDDEEEVEEEDLTSYETKLGVEFLNRLKRQTNADDYGLYHVSFEELCEELKGFLDRHVQLKSSDAEDRLKEEEE